MPKLELGILVVILFYSIKGIISLLGMIWIGKKIKQYFKKRWAKQEDTSKE